jgi:hypothetical protein
MSTVPSTQQSQSTNSTVHPPKIQPAYQPIIIKLYNAPDGRVPHERNHLPLRYKPFHNDEHTNNERGKSSRTSKDLREFNGMLLTVSEIQAQHQRHCLKDETGTENASNSVYSETKGTRYAPVPIPEIYDQYDENGRVIETLWTKISSVHYV